MLIQVQFFCFQYFHLFSGGALKNNFFESHSQLVEAMTDYDDDYSPRTRRRAPRTPSSTIADTEVISSPTSQAQYLNREEILYDLAEKQFPPEDLELILQQKDSGQGEKHYVRSYVEGAVINDVAEQAWMPTVSLVFMPGLDKISVNQAEQLNMTMEVPKQKSARWRVLTAGTLLTSLEFDDNLTFCRTDHTAQVVADVMQRTNAPTNESRASALFRVGREDKVLTIDSDNVKIVNKLVHGNTDLEATLIEVDKFSLFNLVMEFHCIVRDGGPALNTDTGSRAKLLEAMIEHAQRLAIRSPILFRASTRQQIARSRNTRYGVDHGSQFETITTSVGIKNIISKSAACYDSLGESDGPDTSEQALLRPKFLQMLVLLLSLLNDADLQSLRLFLEKTYKIKADRTNIEILVLKVLPLQSINSSIFVRDIINAVQNSNQGDALPDNVEESWNGFIKHLVSLGYTLPGYTEQMGQYDISWIVQIPPGDGFKNSLVFNNLQYCDRHIDFNIIPSMSLGMNHDNGEVTAILTNNKRYLIRVSDHQKITGMIQGNYSIAEAHQQRRTYDLSISEVYVNDYLNQAVQKTNHLLGRINNYFAAVNTTSTLIKVWKRRKAYLYPDIGSCGRLTWHECTINGDRLAIAYKIEGKKIARRDLVRHFTSDIRQVKTTLFNIDEQLRFHERKNRMSDEKRQMLDFLRRGMVEVNQCIEYALRNKQAVERTNLDVGDEPIHQTLFPGSVVAKEIVHWSPYQMRFLVHISESRLAFDESSNLDGSAMRLSKSLWRIQLLKKAFLSSSSSALSGRSRRNIVSGRFVWTMKCLWSVNTL